MGRQQTSIDGVPAAARGRRPIFYGWWIVFAGILNSIYSGGTFYYGFTALFTPIVNEFRWSATATSLAFTMRQGESGVTAPVVGVLVDRFGPRVLAVTGGLAAGLGLILMSYVQGLWAFYGTFLLTSVGLSGASPMLVYITLAHWFRRKRGRAMAIMGIGGALSGLLVPAVVWGVDAYGWRVAIRSIGVGMWLVLVPLGLVLRHKPQQYGYLPDGERPSQGVPSVGERAAAAEEAGPTVRQVLRTRMFWMMCLAFLLWMLIFSSLMVHVMPALEVVGIRRSVASLIVAGVTVLGLVGRVGLAMLADFWDKRLVLAISMALVAAGLLVFAFTTTVWEAILFALLSGAGFGAFIPVRMALQADYFGLRNFGAVQGASQMLATVGGMVGPVFAGWMFDVTGSYRVSFLVLAGAGVLAIPLILSLRPPKKESAAPSL